MNSLLAIISSRRSRLTSACKPANKGSYNGVALSWDSRDKLVPLTVRLFTDYNNHFTDSVTGDRSHHH